MIPGGRCECKKDWNSWRCGMRLVSSEISVSNEISIIKLYIYKKTFIVSNNFGILIRTRNMLIKFGF